MGDRTSSSAAPTEMSSSAADRPSTSASSKMDVDDDDANFKEEQRRLLIAHLATTVNGCLSELGYFPGTVQKLQQLENENLFLREQYNGIFSDNKKLLHWHNLANKELNLLRQELGRLGVVIPNYRPLPPLQVPQATQQSQQHPPIRMRPPVGFAGPSQGMAPPRSHSRRVSLPAIQAGAFQGVGRPPSSASGSSPMSLQDVADQIPHIARMGNMQGPSNVVITSTSSPASASTPARFPAPGPPIAFQNQSRHDQPMEIIDLTDIDGDDSPISEGTRKKPRLEPPDQDVFTLGGQLQEVAIQSPNYPESENGTGFSTPVGGGVSGAIQAEEEEEDIELDEDGLCTIDFCIRAAFTDDEGNGRICRMCEARYNVTVDEDPSVEKPKPFVNAEIADLVKHCETEHPIGWKTLRTPPDASDSP
ncbi:unnamed protein product [Somion occarium]|uniref:Uncharacterized protein n=1 Tax=Somion occarium TaxID=3059160 RepID=A0ABP1CZW8_9APHY